MSEFGHPSQQMASDATRVARVVALRRAVADWFVPPGMKRVLLRIVRRRQLKATTRAERPVLMANARLQGAYAGRRCFVIGNGPSLARVDLEPLAGEIAIVMNAFNRHPALRRWQPTVHCMAEPATAYSDPESVRQLEQFLVGYTTTTHVFPIGVKAVIDRTGLLPPERCAFVKEDGRTAAEFDHIDLTGPVPAAHDTSILAVSVAIAMGCDPIVLLGIDYNWLSHRLVHSHFYDDAAVAWAAEDLSRSPYLDLMKESVQCWEAHAALGRIAARSGQTILNATEGSFLDVYPTTTLAAVLAGAG